MSDYVTEYQTDGHSGLSSITFTREHYSNSIGTESNLSLSGQNSVPSFMPLLRNENDVGLSPLSNGGVDDVSLSDEYFGMLAGNSEQETNQGRHGQVTAHKSNITTTSKCTDHIVNQPPQPMYNQRNMSTNIFSWLDKTENWNIERQRKHSHNLVERRRRFRINDKIKELETLLPGRNRSHYVPQNKSSILTATVDYIKQIQAEQERICLLEERQRRMEQQIIKIIKVLQCIQHELIKEPTRKYLGKCTEKRSASKFNIKGYIPIYQAQRAEDNEDKIEEIEEVYSYLEELNVDQGNNNLSNL